MLMLLVLILAGVIVLVLVRVLILVLPGGLGIFTELVDIGASKPLVERRHWLLLVLGTGESGCFEFERGASQARGFEL